MVAGVRQANTPDEQTKFSHPLLPYKSEGQGTPVDSRHINVVSLFDKYVLFLYSLDVNLSKLIMTNSKSKWKYILHISFLQEDTSCLKLPEELRGTMWHSPSMQKIPKI